MLGFGPADWALPAVLHAHASGRPFAWFDDEASLVEATRHSTGPVTVCAAPGLLSRNVQDALTAAVSFTVPHEAMAAIAFPARPLSYLTARTLPILTRVVAAHHRRSPDRDRSALGLFPDKMIGVAEDDSLTFITGDDLTAAAVRQAPEPDLLMMWGHSREDLFNLGRDGVCGRSFEFLDARADARVPTCTSAGSCVKQGEVVPINRLGAGAVVLGGCNVLRLGGTGLFAPEFSLAFSALEDSASVVVTASGVVIGSPAEFVLLHRLLRGGNSVGESTRLLNAMLPFLGPDSPSYQVLGEGERTLFTPAPETGTSSTQVLEDHTRAEFRGVCAEYVTVEVPHFDPGLQVRFTDDSPQRPQLYFGVVPNVDGSATVHLIGPSRLADATFTVSVSTSRAGTDAIAAVQAATTTLQAYGKLLRGYHPKIKSREPEWRSTQTYLIRQASQAGYDVSACSETDRRAVATAAEIHAVDRALCQHYVERTASARAFTFHEQCLFEDGTFTVTRHAVADACPYCGDEVMHRTLESSVVAEARRVVGICRTCGTIWDRPQHLPAPLLLTDPVLRPAVAQAVGLELRNPLDRRIRGWAGLTVRRARQFGYVTEPSVAEVVLAPGEREVVEFSLSTTESVPTDAEFLRAYFSSELSLTVAQRTIWTAPPQGLVERPASDLSHHW